MSVLRAIRSALPHEHLCYIADSGHAPYGTKTTDYLQQRVMALTQFLLAQNAKVVVIACNTATVAAVGPLRQAVSVPIVAVEPALKPAATLTKTGIVGVLATAATLASAQFKLLLERFGSGVTVLTQACPRLVKQVEAGDLTSLTTRRFIEQYTAPLLAAGADTLVLGSTHYPFLRPLIAEVVGPDVTLIDTGVAVTQQLVRVLTAHQLLNAEQDAGREQFWTSGELETAQMLIPRLWGRPATVQRLPQPLL